jgi:hypothetical protein
MRWCSCTAVAKSHLLIEDLVEQCLEVLTAFWTTSWSEYVVKAGEKPDSKKAFSDSLIRRGFERPPGLPDCPGLKHV